MVYYIVSGLFLMFFWCPCMAIIVNVQHNGGLLPDIILLTQCYLHRGTCLNNAMLLLLLFLTFSVLVANPKKLLYTVANPARGLLNREKRTKEKVWQHDKRFCICSLRSHLNVLTFFPP